MKKILSLILIFFVFFLNSCDLNPTRVIDFQSNFGTLVPSIRKLPLVNVDEPTPPTRDYYTFDGWYMDRDLTIPFVFDKMPKESIQLYAKWRGTIDETPDGLRLLLKDDDTYGVESYVGTEPLLVVPESYNGRFITSIEIEAFKNNLTITEIDLPNTITTIRTYAFSNANSLEYIVIPNSVTNLESVIFSGCNELRVVKFEANSQLTEIGELTFAKMNGLYFIDIPASVKTIAKYAFLDTTTIRYINFESNSTLTTIEESALSSCDNLDFLLIPDSVTTIGPRAINGSSWNPIPIYTTNSSKPAGWDDDWKGANTTIEWGTTREIVSITYANTDDVVLWVVHVMSGTPLIDFVTGENGFLGWYMDKELTQLFTLTTAPDVSITVYTQIDVD